MCDHFEWPHFLWLISAELEEGLLGPASYRQILIKAAHQLDACHDGQKPCVPMDSLSPVTTTIAHRHCKLSNNELTRVQVMKNLLGKREYYTNDCF